MNFNIILASKSPRRQELMQALGIPFSVKTMDVDESFPDAIEARDVAQFLAEKKGDAFDPYLTERDIVITADTTVIQGNTVLNKPQTPREATKMLKALSGNTHQVITGVTVSTKEHKAVFSETTVVHFHTLSENEIAYYVHNFQPLDKAGAYAIQEWLGMIGIKKIEGSYYNVVGLPIDKVYQEIKKIDNSLFSNNP